VFTVVPLVGNRLMYKVITVMRSGCKNRTLVKGDIVKTVTKNELFHSLNSVYLNPSEKGLVSITFLWSTELRSQHTQDTHRQYFVFFVNGKKIYT
jgi:non-homologous end joining protein Ku